MEKVEKRLSVEEFLEMAARPEYAGQRLELIDGEVFKSAAFLDHGEIAATVLGFLFMHVREHRIGRVIGAETGIQVDDETMIAPDGGFYSYERAPRRLPASYQFVTAPDLVFEVVSRSNTAYEIQAKLDKYFAKGTRMVWIIYPSVRQVVVHTQNVAGNPVSATLGLADTLGGGDVLPGFELPVRAIFEDPAATT